MDKRLACALGAVVIGIAGCNQQTPGGPGATNQSNGTTATTANRPTYGEAEGTFDINAPALATRVKQGESATATISLSRGKNFNENVVLKVTELPHGVSIDPIIPMIRNSDKETTLTFRAAPNAALGEFTVKVLGHPDKGVDATSTLKLTILEK